MLINESQKYSYLNVYFFYPDNCKHQTNILTFKIFDCKYYFCCFLLLYFLIATCNHLINLPYAFVKLNITYCYPE